MSKEREAVRTLKIYLVLRLFVRLAHRFPIAVVVLCLSFLVASLLVARESLQVVSERSAMLHPENRFRILAEKYEREFAGAEDLVVVATGGTTAERQDFVDQLLSSLEGNSLYRDVWARTELDYFRQRALFYLTPKQLNELSHRQPGQEMARRVVQQVLQALEQGRPLELDLRPAEVPEAWRPLLSAQRYRYNQLTGHPIHLVLIRPNLDYVATLEDLRAQLRRLQPTFPQLSFGVTGKLAVQSDELASAQADSARATTISCLFILLLFSLSFSSIARPLLAFSCLLTGVGWTLGWITVFIGHLNLLTVTFASILVGLGIDFGIHFLLGYEEQRARGLAPLRAMEHCMRRAGVENCLGAVTAALAFGAICFTDFLAIAELGAITAVGILLCFLAMVTLFPALIFLHDRCFHPKFLRMGPGWASLLDGLERRMMNWPGLVLSLALIFTCWAGWRASGVGFDYNLLHLQDPKLNSVQTEVRLMSAGRGVLAAMSLAPSEKEARRMVREFSRLPSVARVESLLQLLPEEAERKKPLVKQALARLRNAPPLDLKSAFLNERGRLEKLADRRGPGPLRDAAKEGERQLREQARFWGQLLRSQKSEPARLEELPESLRFRGLGRSGLLALRIYPKADLWDHDAMTQFVREVHSVDPEAGGVPISIYFHTLELKRAFESSGWNALAAITVILLLYFRNLSHTVLALLPKLVGILWMLAVMNLCGVDFNPVNFVALPMILGIGLIFGVHVVHSILENPQAPLFRQSTGPAVALSGLTTIIGFATLLGANHRGVASFGFVMAVGVAANLMTSLFLLPCLMRWLGSRRPTRHKPEPSDDDL